jgi:hypothetical protein
MNTYELRADYDEQSIVVYQAYSKAIGLPAMGQESKAREFLPRERVYPLTREFGQRIGASIIK